MRRQPEFVPEAGPRFRIGGKPYVLYATSGLGATLADLGKRLCLSPGTILDAIVSVQPALARHNAWAIDVIYESDAFRSGWDPSDEELATTTAERREALRAKRHRIRAFAFKNKERTHYEHLLAWPNPNGVLALPLSSNFAKLLEQSGRYRATAPNAKALDGFLDQLDLELDRLAGALQEIDEVARRNYPEVSGLMAIASVADVLIDHADEDEITNLQRFKVFVEESVLPVASRRLLIDPEHFTPACAVRDDAGKNVLALLKEPAFIAEIRVVVENRDVVDPYVHDRLYMQLERAAVLLLRTKYADTFVGQEVMPAMRSFGKARGKAVDRFLGSLSEGEVRTFFDNGWTAELPLGESALGAALVANNIMINTVTNVEGPMSLGVAVFAISAPRILERFAENPLGYSGHRIFSATVVRMLLAYGKGSVLEKLQFGKILSMASELPVGERVPHVHATYKTTFKLLNENMYRSTTGRAFTGLLLMVALFGVVGKGERSENHQEVLAGTLQVLAAAGGAALGVADLAPVANMLEQRVEAKLLTLATKRIATFVSVAGIVVALYELVRDRDRGDDLGEWIAGGNAVGGVLALAMWALASAKTMPAGVVLFGHTGAAVAAIVLIIVGVAQIIDIVRSMSGTEAFVAGVIEHLGREGGSGGDASRTDGEQSSLLRAGMRESVVLLRSLAKDAHFFRLPESARESLRARGFAGDTLALIMAD